MDVEPGNEMQAIRYLLGELSEAEQSRLEERFFHDAELSELLSEVEDDLIDQYVRKELSARDRLRFERHFLISERRREKIELARALLQSEKASATAEVTHQQKASVGWKVLLSRLQNSPYLSYSMAAAVLLLLISGIWLVYDIRQLQREVTQMKAERDQSGQQEDQLRKEATELRQRSDELAAQNEKLQEELSLLKQQSETQGKEPGTASSLLALVLSPGSRSNEAVKSLIVSGSVQTVRLQLNLNAGYEYRAYQVKLQTAAGALIRSWKRLSTASVRGKRVVFVAVPAGLLSEGQYELTVSGIAEPNRIEDVDYYYFRVQKE